MSVILSQLRWPSLAQDLAVMSVPGTPLTEMSLIYATYNISDRELKEILTIPHFQDLFKQALAVCKAQGTKAGTIYRAATLSAALSEKLFRDASNGAMESKDAIKFLELLLKAGGLLDGKDNSVQVQTNVGVSLALPYGLNNPKIKHIPQQDAIDV